MELYWRLLMADINVALFLIFQLKMNSLNYQFVPILTQLFISPWKPHG